MSACDDKQDEFLKNEYILNLNDLIRLCQIKKDMELKI